MAVRVDPLQASARHQALHHFVAKSEWSDIQVMARVCDWVVPMLGLDSGCYWIIDDTGFPKKGKHSVGVARQYCGQLGIQENCQVAVSLSLASAQGSIPIAYQLYGLRPVAPPTDFLNSLLNSQIAKNRLVWSSVQLPQYNLRSATLARCATGHDRRNTQPTRIAAMASRFSLRN